MDHRYFIILLLLTVTSQLFAQKSLQVEFDDKIVSDVYKLLINKEAERRNDTINGFLLSAIKDSIVRCETIRKNVINKALNYIGVDYHYGWSSEKGFDCSGYVKFIFQSIGLALPHSSLAQYKLSTHLETSDARSGDLVFFITRGERVSHVGIYLGNNLFVHSPGRGRTVSIDSLDKNYYKRHLVGFGSVL